MTKKRRVLFIDGKIGDQGDFPIAIICDQTLHNVEGVEHTEKIVDPIFNYSVTNNLYGRVMTLLEATIENPERLKAIKKVFNKEIKAWERDVYADAREIANGHKSSSNIYLRNSDVQLI